MVIQNFKGFKGQHCESTATLSLLAHQGLDMSEPMFFGLGEGLGFIYWKMKIMNLPFLGGRSKSFDLTRRFCENMAITLDSRETGSRKTAWSNVAEFIDNNIPVGLQVDCYYLDYFSRPFHFAGHFLTVYGYDNEYASVVDTAQQGTFQKTTLESLEKARFEKGPMSAKARSWTLKMPEKIPAIKTIIPKAVKAVAAEFLHPPIKNFGYSGILKLSKEIVKWIDMAPDPAKDLAESAEVMEKGGTGGALFRNFYRDFLKESLEYIPGNNCITQSHELYKKAAANWTETAALIRKAGITGEHTHLEKAAALCKETADVEKKAMEILGGM
ncbi:MAG: BtrH N-terminal domain-containing protein [Spirochaetales bacterium]|nr:BtrH N-terminal domain-containing protein [Spirochaetales bacterium]